MKLGEQGDKTMKSAKNSYSYHCGMGIVKVSVTKQDLDPGRQGVTIVITVEFLVKYQLQKGIWTLVYTVLLAPDWTALA